MHHWHSENAYLYEERGGLSSINLKALRRQLGFHPPRRGRPPFFLDWSFERQFNSGSRSIRVRLVTRLHSSVTRLHSSKLDYTRLVIRLCFLNRSIQNLFNFLQRTSMDFRKVLRIIKEKYN